MNLKVKAKLDPGFEPLSLKIREFKEQVGKDGIPVVIAVERTFGAITSYKTTIFKEGTGHDEDNYKYVERIAKTLLWVAGGFKIIFAGSNKIGERLKVAYTSEGERAFDVHFFETVYERPFEVSIVSLEDAPETKGNAQSIGRHLDGCRIGFDAGGSDRKVSAVINGESVYSEEVVWSPKIESDPTYHFNGIYDAFRTAASKMPKVDAIGVSTAGVIIDNKPMVSSLFLKVPEDLKKKFVQPIYLNCADKLGRELGYNIPIEVANDGDVTALAGAMDLGKNAVLGVAMGTSEAGGYVDNKGNITGWLNELAFVPVDYNEKSMVDEWSGDYGCGVKYFSQDGVIKLAPAAGIKLDDNLTLDIFWGMYEIMGVSLVDMYLWRWLYEHPDADAEDLRDNTVRIAREIWNKYYEPVLGTHDSPILAVYSHIVNSPMYLPNYPFGHIIEYQLEEYFSSLPDPESLGPEIIRIYKLGRLTPQLWMQQAVGSPVSIEPILKAVNKILGC